jgi:dienelactone hydrolase
MASTVTLTSKIDNAEITALHAEPAAARRGGIILIQEIFGLDQFVQADVELWASLGFEVVAPSMFDRQEKGFTADHSQEGMQKGFGYMQANGWDNPISDVQACVDLLSPRAAHPDVPVYDYEAGHGFNNKGGAGYYPEASELARQRTLDLFAQNGAK